MTTEIFNENLIICGLQAENAEDAIRSLGKLLYEHGYVKDTFCDAAVEREKVFATGLPVEPQGVAIPHTDAQHVNKLGIAVGVLAAPVAFGLMGGEGEVEVGLVFLLALDNCVSQISALQSLAELVHRDGVIEKIRSACDRQTICQVLQSEITVKIDTEKRNIDKDCE